MNKISLLMLLLSSVVMGISLEYGMGGVFVFGCVVWLFSLVVVFSKI